jgi:hypothetical protein
MDGVIGKTVYPQVTNIPYTNNPLAVVSDFFFRKATKTLDAMCVLCECGFAEDALVLGRTLFELCVHLLTIASPDSIEQQRIRAESFIYDSDRQRVANLKELAKLKRQGKCLSWITEIEALNPVFQTITVPEGFVPLKNLKDMATELGEDWECRYHFFYWAISKNVHPSGFGSDTYIQECDEEAEISRAIAITVTMHYCITGTGLTLLDLEILRPSLEDCIKDVLAYIED